MIHMGVPTYQTLNVSNVGSNAKWKFNYKPIKPKKGENMFVVKDKQLKYNSQC